MQIVLATKNPGKLKELKEIAAMAWAHDLGSSSPTVDLPAIELLLAPEEFDPEETGYTYLENAILKAKAAAELTGMISVADDSGLAVDSLNGRPGLHSARYCEGSDRDRRIKLLSEMKDIPKEKRQARFVCVMAVYDPKKDAAIYNAEGIWKGRIAFEERGQNGFGFDPIFYMEDKDVTAAELPAHEKNKYSHRGQAWRQVLTFLEKTFMPR